MTHPTAPNLKASPTDAAGDTEAAPGMSAAELGFAQIRARLDRHFPDEPYLPDALLAETLKKSPKTLANIRSAKPDRYPTPLKLGDSKEGMHTREDFIDWLAREELDAKARIVHRCR